MRRFILFGFLSVVLTSVAIGQSLERVGGDYFDEGPGVAMVSHDGNLYVMGDENLYRIDLSDGSRHRVGSEGWGVRLRSDRVPVRK